MHLQSRTGRALSAYFPDITHAVRHSPPPAVVVDGELVVWWRDRISFAMLHRRLTAGVHLLRVARDLPAHYVVFDLLRDDDGQVLMDL